MADQGARAFPGFRVTDIDCAEVRGHLEQFLDFELAKDACSLVTEHLTRCGACNDRAYFAREVRQIVARKCATSPPPDLALRIQALIVADEPATEG